MPGRERYLGVVKGVKGEGIDGPRRLLSSREESADAGLVMRDEDDQGAAQQSSVRVKCAAGSIKTQVNRTSQGSDEVVVNVESSASTVRVLAVVRIITVDEQKAP